MSADSGQYGYILRAGRPSEGGELRTDQAVSMGTDFVYHTDWSAEYHQHCLYQHPHPHCGNWYAAGHWYERGKSVQSILVGRSLLWPVLCGNRKRGRIYLRDFGGGCQDRCHSAGGCSHSSNRRGNRACDRSLPVCNVHSVKKNQ